jgi:hypothetical protein
LLVEAEVTCSDDEVLGVADGQALVFLWQPETTAVINSSEKSSGRRPAACEMKAVKGFR